ncbi:MAG: hypothetical protein ACR2PL_16615 [Dehalococcoidia bacterium]
MPPDTTESDAYVARACRNLMAGDLGEAEQLMSVSLVVGRSVDDEEAQVYFLTQQHELLAQWGRLAEIEPALRKHAEETERVRAWRCLLIDAHVAMGRHREARQELIRIAADRFVVVPRDGNWLNCLTLLADCCAAVGAIDVAGSLYDLLLPYATRAVVAPVFATCRGSVSRSLGVLAALR